MRKSGFASRGSGFKSLGAGLKRTEFKKRPTKRKAGYSNPNHMRCVAGLGCAICRRLGLGWVAAEVHHRRTGTGGGRRAKDIDTCPLCPNHHTGADGIHQGRKAWELRFGVTELELIAEAQSMLGYSQEVADEC